MTQLLATILALVMTWTVESKSTVSGDGTWPYDIEVAYSNTNSKGTVRSGDDAVLTLSHLEGITVERVDVYVKSNKTGGGGTFAVTANGATLATKSGTFKAWVGRYDNDSYHAITLFSGLKTDVNELVVSLHGTENTLYVEKYVVQYAMPSPRTVTLMKGSQPYAQLTEEQGGAGVVLPIMLDTAQWRFVGWSETDFAQTGIAPVPYKANDIYYPAGDCLLWAVYAYYDQVKEEYATELESGEYLYVNRYNNIALAGVPTDGKMNYASIDPTNKDLLYTIEFAGTDTAYITHTMTSTPIGYKSTNMAKTASPWLVYHSGEETRFYTVINNKTYVLWLGVWGEYGSIGAGLFHSENLNDSPLALCYPDEVEEPVFTCYPEYGLGWQEASAEAGGAEYILHLGNYQLWIRDGRKELKIEK